MTNFIIFLKIILALSVIGKAYLHSFVGYRNDVPLGGTGGFSLKTLWFFTEPVAKEFQSRKNLCNYLQLLNILILLLIVILNKLH